MNRRTFLTATAGTAGWLASQPLRAAGTDRPETDDELLAQARQRIDQHRQGDGVIVVRGADGHAIANATVKIEQTRHDFLFGCSFFRFGRLQDEALQEQYNSRFVGLFNFATLGFYWPSYEPERGKPIYDYTDRVLDFCTQNGLTAKGHPLVWDFADPRWLPHDFAEIRELSNARVRDCVSRFKGRLDCWDVVNEPTHLGRFKTRMGEWAMSMDVARYVGDHLRIARAANPGATLLVNDYRTDPPFAKILDALRADGGLLFDAIGLQSHMHDGGWPLARIWKVCGDFARFNVPIHFTETTIVSGPRTGPGERWGPTTPALEERQAEYVPKFYTMLFGHPSVQALTWWDFSDNGAWQRAAAGLVRRDMSPKPVYEKLLETIKGAWWTKTSGQTDAKGELAVRAFYGRHRLTVELPNGRTAGRDIHWQRGKDRRITVVV